MNLENILRTTGPLVHGPNQSSHCFPEGGI